MMDTLHDILWNSTLEVLNFRLKLLAAKPITGKKADCIDAIKQCYAGRGLEDIWWSLGELERLAVGEACHALDCQLDLSRFEAKYADTPLFYHVSEKDRYDSYRYLNKVEFATRLNLLLFTLGRDHHAVPSDLAERLRDFIPEPRDAEIKTLLEPKEQDGLIVRLTENDSLADLTAMLHLAEQGNFKVSEKTGMPSAARAMPAYSNAATAKPPIKSRLRRNSRTSASASARADSSCRERMKRSSAKWSGISPWESSEV